MVRHQGGTTQDGEEHVFPWPENVRKRVTPPRRALSCGYSASRISYPDFMSPLRSPLGKDIPGQASLVFDVALLDLHNPKDGISIENKVVPENCERRSQSGDFLRYHYNGTLLDGTLFDSR